MEQEALTLMSVLRDEPELAYELWTKIRDLNFTEEQRRQLDYELGIVCYYLGKKQQGFEALNRVMLSNSLLAYEASCNMYWYVEPIPIKMWKRLNTQVPDGYRCLNPSIIRYKSGYLVNLRASNYAIIDGHYFAIDSTNIINNLNYIQYLDKDLNVQWTKPLDNIDITYPINACGIEDIRLTEQLMFTCNSRNNHPYRVPRVSIGIITDLNSSPVKFELQHQPSPDGNTDCEKNWLLIRSTARTSTLDKMIKNSCYLYDPFTLIDKGKVYRIDKIGHLRCSAGPIWYKNGLVFLVHELLMKDNKRVYTHRLCHWNVNDSIYTISFPFFFHHRGIEYGMSMCWYHGNFLVSMGLKDGQAWLAEIERKEVDKLLENGTQYRCSVEITQDSRPR